ncbi:MAG TPA: hypothetical protein VFI11_14980 [Anaerolineales bacterium]|nr:hypothetical protein [Anaerolineales bacterium]
MVTEPRFPVTWLRSVGCVWIGAGLAVGATAWVALAVLGLILRPSAVPAGNSTPILTIIPAPSPTPSPTPAVPSDLATPTVTAPAGSGEGISVGELVEVFGTSGDGLRLRSEPDLQSQILVLGVDSEVFQVDDGPVEADGYVWFYLVNPYDTAKRGWAVSTYLRPLGSS